MRRTPGKITGFALKHLLKKPATIAYPHGPLSIDPNYRGRLVYRSDNCIGCQLCVRDCPASAIRLVNAGTREDKRFELHLDYGHCIFCGQCADNCPKGCLHMSQDIELGALSRDEMRVVLR